MKAVSVREREITSGSSSVFFQERPGSCCHRMHSHAAQGPAPHPSPRGPPVGTRVRPAIAGATGHSQIQHVGVVHCVSSTHTRCSLKQSRSAGRSGLSLPSCQVWGQTVVVLAGGLCCLLFVSESRPFASSHSTSFISGCVLRPWSPCISCQGLTLHHGIQRTK